MLNERGEYLSKRVKTKWYQEGEKSTKYFLNMQRSKSKKTEMQELLEGNEVVTDRTRIKGLVETFYRNLYEKGDNAASNDVEINDYLSVIDKVNTEKILN